MNTAASSRGQPRICGILGVVFLVKASAIEFARVRNVATVFCTLLLLASAYLLLSFIRGLPLDLSLEREGLVTAARIVRIEEGRLKHGSPWWSVHFTFTDTTGTVRESEFEETDEDGATKWKVEQYAQIRYHPAEPSIRLLD